MRNMTYLWPSWMVLVEQNTQDVERWRHLFFLCYRNRWHDYKSLWWAKFRNLELGLSVFLNSLFNIGCYFDIRWYVLRWKYIEIYLAIWRRRYYAILLMSHDVDTPFFLPFIAVHMLVTRYAKLSRWNYQKMS